MSMRKAIDEKCKDCIYDPEVEGGWKQQVWACELQACALWPHRTKPRTPRQSPKMTSETCHFEITSSDKGVWV